jgi:seryl-tRNA synthetase
MLSLRIIRENKELVAERLAIKNFNATALIDEIINLDKERRNTQSKLDTLLAEANQMAKSIGQFYKSGERDKAEVAKNRSTELKQQTKELSSKLTEFEELLNKKLVELPNIPHESVPKGNSDADNVTIYEEGDMPNLPEKDVPLFDQCTHSA